MGAEPVFESIISDAQHGVLAVEHGISHILHPRRYHATSTPPSATTSALEAPQMAIDLASFKEDATEGVEYVKGFFARFEQSIPDLLKAAEATARPAVSSVLSELEGVALSDADESGLAGALAGVARSFVSAVGTKAEAATPAAVAPAADTAPAVPAAATT